MAGPWEEFQQPASGPWDQFAATPTQAPAAPSQGVGQAFVAGLQDSSGGLAWRKKLPDVQLDPETSTWYERLAKGAGGFVGDAPAGLVGLVGGGVAGTATAGPVGGAIGMGAGAMALPAAIREAYMQAYTKGEIENAGDFLARTGVVLASGGKAAVIGGVTGGAGKVAGGVLGVAAPNLSRLAAGTISTGVEATAATVSSAALEGHLPHLQDWADNALFIAGMRGVAATPSAVKAVSGKLATVYRQTGKTPYEVMADAAKEPSILDDLAKVEEPKPMPEMGAKADPFAEYGPDLTSHSGLPEAYRAEAATKMAMEAMPTDKLKAVIDKPFADVPDTKLPEGLNLNHVENFDQLASFDARMTEVFKDEINAQRGGTQGWAETVAKGESLLRTAAGEEAVNLLRREAGTADTAHVLHARGMMMFKALSDAKEAATAYETAPAELKPQLMAQALEAANKAAAFKSYFTGASAEAGRALQFLQYMKDARAQADVMTKMLDAYNGQNPDALLRALSNADSMAEISKMVEAANKPDFFDKYMDYRRAGLMSGYMTIARNGFGGALMLGKNVLTDAYAAMSSRLMPGADHVPFAQAVGRLTGYTFAAGTMLKEAARTFREAESVKQGIKDVSMDAWDSAVERSGGVKPLALSAEGNLIERAAYYQAKGVFGANTLVDGLMRNFGFYGEAYSRAATEAVNNGLSVGSKQFMDFVQDRVSNMSEKDIAAANKVAAEVVFAGETGPLLQKVYNTLNDFRYMKIVVPFVGVPGKMLEAGTRLSPFAPLMKTWREDVAAGGERAQRAHAEAAMGRIMWATTVNMFRDDMITGYGPPEPDKRAVWLMTHQPYSVKIGNDWYNYGQSLQPIGPMLGMVADVAQVADLMTDDELDRAGKAGFLTLKNGLGNLTMLQGLADFFAIATDENGGPQFLRNMATSNLPASGLLGNIAQSMDPYQREVYNLLDAVKARIPGLRETLNPKRDALGHEVVEPDKLALGIIPAKSVPVNTDKIASEAARLKVGVGKLDDHIDLPAGGDKRLGKVKLTPEERDAWGREAGAYANQMLQGAVNAPGWDKLPDAVQESIMKNAFSAGREYGKAVMFSPERTITEVTRINKGVQKNYGQQK